MCVCVCVCVCVCACVCVCVCVCVRACVHTVYASPYLVLYRNAQVEGEKVEIHKVAGSNCHTVICATCVCSSLSAKLPVDKDLLPVAEWLSIKTTL